MNEWIDVTKKNQFDPKTTPPKIKSGSERTRNWEAIFGSKKQKPAPHEWITEKNFNSTRASSVLPWCSSNEG